MKGLKFHETYTPHSCSVNSSHMAVTLGAGAQDHEVFEALAEYNAVTVGGTFDVSGRKCFKSFLSLAIDNNTSHRPWESSAGPLAVATAG